MSKIVNKVRINGREYEFPADQVLVVIGGRISLEGQMLYQERGPGGPPVVELIGDPLAVYSSSAVKVNGDVGGNVDTMGAVEVLGHVTGRVSTQGRVEVGGDVRSAVNTQGSVEVQGSVDGNVNTMGAVNVRGHVAGKISTMGKVIVGSKG